MKKALLLLTITVTSFAGYAQNGLGVGNTNPQEMLDVSGAIRIGNSVISAPANAGTIRWNTSTTQFEGWDGGQWVVFGGGGGTVTTVSLTTSNGVSGTVANPTTTPAISVQLGAITPASVAATGTVTGSNISGANTGDQAAEEVDVTPVSGVSATDVQAALVELQGEIDAIAPTIENVLTNGDVAADDQSLKINQVRAIDGDGLLLTDDADNGIFIRDGGNVGIGTSGPDYLLDVFGVGVPAPSTTDNILARFKVETSARGAGIQIEGTRNSTGNVTSFVDLMNNNNIAGRLAAERGAADDGSLLFYTNSGSTLTERMRINSTGTITIDGDGAGTGGSYTLPAQRGTNGQVLSTDGSGNASWAAGIPSGAVMYFNLAGCPTGWSELTAARGRYIVGLPGGGTLNGTAGTALSNQENRASGQHDHTVDPPSTSSSTDGNHQHTIRTEWGTTNGLNIGAPNGQYNQVSSSTSYQTSNPIGAAGDHSHTTDISQFNSGNSGSVAGTNAPYIQLRVCQKD
jgi:hypothetical protein